MNKIVFFGQPGCMPCHKLHMDMRKKGIEYIYKDVRQDIRAQQEMLHYSNGNFLTPTIVINEGETVLQNPDLRSVEEAAAS